MKIKYISKLLLSLLFLFAYQTSTVHSTKHFVEELECHLCETTKVLSVNAHKTSAPIFVELNSLQTFNVAERLCVTQPLDLTQEVKALAKDFSGLKVFAVPLIPLGYFSHAPPYIFS